jgi:hypothetical protein
LLDPTILELGINNLTKFVVVTIFLIIASGCSSINMNSTNSNKLESEVLDAFRGLVAASESLDSDRYFEFFDKEKFTGLNADGSVWHSFENMEVLISSGFPQIERSITLEFNNVKVTIINPITAILVNEYSQSILLKSGDIVKQSGGGTQVWSKTDGAWKLVSVSASQKG